MKRLILALSVVLNLVLAAGLKHLARDRAKAADPTSPARVATGAQIQLCSPAPTPNIAALPETQGPDARRYVKRGFDWAQLAAANYEQYVANLRAIGCPEKTIRDIVVSAVDREYARREALLPQPPFWSAGILRARAEHERAVDEHALELQRRELLTRLLRFDCLADVGARRDDLIEQAIFRYFLGPVREGVAEEVMGVMRKGDALVNEIRQASDGRTSAEQEAQVEQCREQQMSEMRQALSPAEFEEFTARGAGMYLMDHGIEYLRVTALEMREIARLHATIFGMGSGRPFDFFGRGNESEGQTKQFEDALRLYLGETRYAEYQSAKNLASSSVTAKGGSE